MNTKALFAKIIFPGCAGLLLMLNGISSSAQIITDGAVAVTPAEPEPQPMMPKHGLSLKVTPSSLLDRFCPNIPVGIEYNSRERFGAGFNFAIPVRHIKTFRKSNTTHTFSRNIKAELYCRYYFNPAHRKGQWFLGLESFYKEQFFQANYIYYEKGGEFSTYASENVRVRKFVTGAALYFGIRSNTAKHLYLEVYTGIGKKLVNTNIYADNITYIGGRGIGYFPKTEANEDEHDAERDKVYFPLALTLAYRF